MVLLEQRIAKLENHHHHHGHGHPEPPSEALSASFQAFRSDVSNCLNQLLLKPELEILSLEWNLLCFQILSKLNQFFAKLIVEIDYPMGRWGAIFMEEYLNYSLDLLDNLNCISSSLSHLDLSRLPLLHALSLLENSPSMVIKHLKPIQIKNFDDFPKQGKMKNRGDGEAEEKFNSGEEKVIHQALKEIQSIGFWICGVLLSTLSGTTESYKEIKKLSSESDIPSLTDLDSCFSRVIVKGNGELEEVKELNRAVAALESEMVEGKSSDAAKELEQKLNVFEKLVENLTKEVEGFFSEIFATRNRLLDGVRHPESTAI